MKLASSPLVRRAETELNVPDDALAQCVGVRVELLCLPVLRQTGWLSALLLVHLDYLFQPYSVNVNYSNLFRSSPVLLKWQGYQDSNPDFRFWRPTC